MKRRVLNYSLFILLLGAVSFIGYKFLSEFTTTKAHPLDAVPADAAIVFEVRDLPAVWNKLTKTNLMWPDLKDKTPFDQLHKAGSTLEKALLKNPGLLPIVSKNTIVISLHKAAEGITFFIAIGNINDETDGIAFIEKVSGTAPAKSREYDGCPIYHFSAGSFDLKCGFYSGVLLISNSESSLEDGLSRLMNEKTFDENKVFQKLNHTVSKTVDANIYVQHKYLNGLLEMVADKNVHAVLENISPYADMTELDLLIGPNNLSFSGFTLPTDSSASLVSIFKNQEPQSFTITRFVPDKIKQMLFIGLSDPEKYIEDYEARLKKQNKLNDYRDEINTFNRENDCNLRDQLISWIGHELVLFTASYDSSNAENKFLVIKKNETGKAVKDLNKLARKLDTTSRPILISEGIELQQLKADNIFSILLGDLFEDIDQPYFININDHLIFCESSTALQKYLSDLIGDRVLARNVTFVNYVNENLSTKSNLFYYSNVGKMKDILQPAIHSSLKETLIKNEELFTRFDAFSWQLSQAEGMFYNHVYMRYNPSYKEEESTFWEYALDTTVHMKPQLLLNHYTNAKDIFVQDDDYTVYYISNTGKLLWKKALVEKIIGDVRQVDMLNNGKLQMAFCTESQLHIIDIKGNYYSGYPANLPSVCTGQLAVFDYENDKNYRFFIPSENKLMNIDKEGKATQGWNFTGAETSVQQPAEFHRINGKDYIFVIDLAGNTYILDRKGKSRYDIKKKISDRSGNAVYFETGKEIENCFITYSDSVGTIHRLYFNGRTDSLHLRSLGTHHYFAMTDANADGKKDILLHEDDKLTIHSWNKELLLEHIFNRIITVPPMVFLLKDRTVRVGALNKDENLIYVIDEDGLMNEKFPVTGSTLFMMEDINNDSHPDIVVGNHLGKIYSYMLK